MRVIQHLISIAETDKTFLGGSYEPRSCFAGYQTTVTIGTHLLLRISDSLFGCEIPSFLSHTLGGLRKDDPFLDTASEGAQPIISLTSAPQWGYNRNCPNTSINLVTPFESLDSSGFPVSTPAFDDPAFDDPIPVLS